jgi:SAM-dependent methyltransferase
MGLSVLYRRNLLRAHVCEVVATRPAARVLSIGSGHCRELADTPFHRASVPGLEFVALDQDPESCAKVSDIYSSDAITVVNRSLKRLLGGALFDQNSFDLVYSAGMFDYLDSPLATRIVSTVAKMLRPGGRLMVANFLPESFGRGYMEAFLDWRLRYRSLQELVDLGRDSLLRLENSFVDPSRNVGYVEWTTA